MPNNYILGYDVDSAQVEQDKLIKAETLLAAILETIAKRQTGVNNLIQGTFPAIKSTIINPLFNRFAISTSKFYATDACTGCGLCERICPVGTIKVNGKPSWGKACTQCLACINRCPVCAIQYGKGTESKGRYMHPILVKRANHFTVSR
jgi:NAD-dependent dihydropyrimidine dehydrogenase PreA subunit